MERDPLKYEKIFITECEKLDKLSRLETVLNKVNELGCTDKNISFLELMIKMEYSLEFKSTPPLSIYFKRIKNIIDDELKHLIENEKKPKLRLSFWKDCIKIFKSELDQEKSRIKHNL